MKKIIIFCILYLSGNFSYADECTDLLNAYTASLEDSIAKSTDEKKKEELTDSLARINRYRQTMEDCDARYEMLYFLYKDDPNHPIHFLPKDHYYTK